MAINTIYMLRLQQTWDTGGRPMENVFFYDHTAGVGDAFTLATDFVTTILPLINAIQGATVKNVDVNVVNLGDLGDFSSPITTGSGAIGGESLPPFAAIGYTLKVNTRAVRKGSKRFSGVPEAVQAQGLIIDATYKAAMEALRVAMQLELVSAADTWLPVVIKRVKTAVVGTVPTKYTYRLPTIDAELVVGEIVVALTSFNVSHQVSREL